MAKRESTGLLLYEHEDGVLRVLLVHPGGPFFSNKDEDWSIPKGVPDHGEDLLACALREFAEETGHEPAASEYLPLGSITQKGGKEVTAWAFAGKWYPGKFHSNTFSMEWPPRSGNIREFPEIDRAELFDMDEAKAVIKEAQIPFLEKLERHLKL